MVDTSQPMSLGAFIALAGFLLTWVLGAIAIRKFIVDERKRRREDEAHLDELILKVCRSFTESDAYQLKRDRAMISVAQSVTVEEFKMRASSFVDSGVDAERRQQVERRITMLENATASLKTDFAVAAAGIAKEVVQAMKVDRKARASGDTR